MKRRFSTVSDIVEWRLCLGCGACESACKKHFVTLKNRSGQGIRPEVEASDCGTCIECLRICPGLYGGRAAEQGEGIESLQLDWGHVTELWEGFAADEEMRHMGSSGGVSSALGLYCLEKEAVGRVVHTSGDNSGLMNRTAFSRSREDLLTCTGSRYAPASPCDSIDEMSGSQERSVFIGKPCDIQGVRRAENTWPELKDKIRLAVSVFCAGAPSRDATIDLIESLKMPVDRVARIRYRGRGWPGNFAVWTKGGDKPAIEIPYLEAWSFLQKYRPYRCYLCPDGTGELADISCGDPWYRKERDGEGYSLILVRTKRGHEVFHRALDAGYLKAEQVDPKVLALSQPGFLAKRGAVWGRLLAMKLWGIPTPQYDGWPLYDCWKKLPATEKTRSVLGTIKRIVRRKYYRREKYGNE